MSAGLGLPKWEVAHLGRLATLGSGTAMVEFTAGGGSMV